MGGGDRKETCHQYITFVNVHKASFGGGGGGLVKNVCWHISHELICSIWHINFPSIQQSYDPHHTSYNVYTEEKPEAKPWGSQQNTAEDKRLKLYIFLQWLELRWNSVNLLLSHIHNKLNQQNEMWIGYQHIYHGCLLFGNNMNLCLRNCLSQTNKNKRLTKISLWNFYYKNILEYIWSQREKKISFFFG